MNMNEFYICIKTENNIDVILIKSNSIDFIDFIKKSFPSVNIKNHQNHNAEINVSFDIPIQIFAEMQRSLIPADCGLLLDENFESKTLNIYSVFSSKKLFKSAFRILRSFLSRLILASGALSIHASCVADSNGAICIIGDKFSGKTTLLLTLLNKGFDFISNDKPYIYCENNVFYASALPVSAGIRYGTLEINTFFYNEILKIQDSEDVDFSSNGRVHISPQSLCEIFNVKFISNAKIRKIIVLSSNYDHEVNNFIGIENIKKNILQSNSELLASRFLMQDFIICPSYKTALESILG